MHTEFTRRNELDNLPEAGHGRSIKPFESGLLPEQKKLRLCYISNPNIIHTRRWVGWFAQHGHNVCLLADVPPKEPWSDVPMIDLSAFFHTPLLRFGVWAVWLRRFLHQWRPDVLHAHRVNSAGWLAASSGFHPYVVTPWGSDVFLGPQRSWVARLLARYTLRHADCVTIISQAIRERVIELNAQPSRIRSVHFGVDLEIFNPGDRPELQADELRRELGLPATAPVIFSPRAVHPIYNLDMILRAIPQVRERFPQAVFVFTMYNPDPEYKKMLDGLIAELGVVESVRWLAPTRDPGAMAARYRSSDVVVSVPSSDGGTPVTVMEAMACGKPVVCSDLPPLREFITSGENGWLVPVRQAAPLAEAILRLLENPARAAEFGQKAQRMVSEKASLGTEMQHMEDIYFQLAKIRKG